MTQEYFRTPKKKEILKKIIDWSSNNSFFEICGLIGRDEDQYVIFLCENKSKTPSQSFSIDPIDYILFLEKYDPIALFHTHIRGNEEPSEKDIIMSENSCLPFLIYSTTTRKFKIYTPKHLHVNEEELENFQKLQ